MLLATIAEGNNDAADICFLIAAIFFGLAAISRFAGPRAAPADHPARVWPWTGFLVDVGLCLVAIGLLLL
jgi:hypothetical protein